MARQLLTIPLKVVYVRVGVERAWHVGGKMLTRSRSGRRRQVQQPGRGRVRGPRGAGHRVGRGSGRPSLQGIVRRQCGRLRGGRRARWLGKGRPGPRARRAGEPTTTAPGGAVVLTHLARALESKQHNNNGPGVCRPPRDQSSARPRVVDSLRFVSSHTSSWTVEDHLII